MERLQQHCPAHYKLLANVKYYQVLFTLNAILFFQLHGLSGGELLLIPLTTLECTGDTFALHRLIEPSGSQHTSPDSTSHFRQGKSGTIPNNTSETPGLEFRFPEASPMLALLPHFLLSWFTHLPQSPNKYLSGTPKCHCQPWKPSKEKFTQLFSPCILKNSLTLKI